MSDHCFAVCAPGLASLAATELRELGVSGAEEPAGVSFDADAGTLFRANLHVRTATRVLLRVGSFRARTFAELERRARALPWDRLLGQGTKYRLRVSCAKSKLYHEGAVEERLHGVIEALTGARPVAVSGGSDGGASAESGVRGAASEGDDAESTESEAAEAQLFVVRFFRDVCTVSADTSGAPLYMRGYRQELARAPLRETLAAAMLLASRWTMDELLVDPFCGSGTIPIEAALLARRIPPGIATPHLVPRQYRFQSWPEYHPEVWATCVADARERVLDRAPAPLQGFDRDAGAIRAARANAMRAGVQGDVELRERDFDALAPVEQGWLVTNPPYGVRVGDPNASEQLFAKLGKAARSTFAGWTICALAPPPLRRALGSGTEEVFQTRNGGIAVGLFVRKGER